MLKSTPLGNQLLLRGRQSLDQSEYEFVVLLDLLTITPLCPYSSYEDALICQFSLFQRQIHLQYERYKCDQKPCLRILLYSSIFPLKSPNLLFLFLWEYIEQEEILLLKQSLFYI